jgi:formamidopyrimidine-DNA glycosylase
MPSLPELEIYKRDLTADVVGRPITQIEPLDFRVVRATTAALDGLLKDRAVSAIHRYGKWLYLDTGAPEQLIIHLGLTGKLSLIDPAAKLPRYAAFVLHLGDGRRLVMADQRHLGKVYVRDFAGLKAEKSLGPDLLDLTADYFVGTLRHKQRGVRDVLMDQKIIAGIGGKYADEILWQAKLHPRTKLDLLDDAALRHLYELTRSITATAIALDADVDRFPPDWLIPHRRTDKLCPLGHGPLTEHASAFHCPVCQPAPNPSRRG